MADPRIPTVILGGSDRRPAQLPEGAGAQHPLGGYKGVAVTVDGRPLVQIIVERLTAADRFGPVHVAGPLRVYGGVVGEARVIDTDGTFGDNIRAAIDAIRPRHPRSPIAFITCDVLPEVSKLRRLMEQYDAAAPCDLWFPLVRAPERSEELGASAWKPAYRIVPEPGHQPVGILPGHLVLADPGALRLKFLYRLFDLGYRTRNRPIDSRRSVMIRSLLADMLYQDFLHLLGLRMPSLTWSVLRAAIPASRLLREGVITRRAVEDALRKIFVKYSHRRRHPERRIHLPLVDALSLARDIDTEEEARELGGRVSLR